VLPNPVILSAGTSLRPLVNEFGFTISWAVDGAVVVVETTSNLTTPTWTPISTNTIGYDATVTDPLNGAAAFRDPHWKNTPSRFYRLVSR
jgi:hypothetical protein